MDMAAYATLIYGAIALIVRCKVLEFRLRQILLRDLKQNQYTDMYGV